MSEKLWTFNGIDARTGDYLLEVTPELIGAVARGEPIDKETLRELKDRRERVGRAQFSVKEGVDVGKLAETGWGVVFPAVADGGPEAKEQAEIIEALRPLLDHRKAQATVTHGHYYREYVGTKGVRAGESKNRFLARNGGAPGPVDPDRVPYYLLIVADPQTISFRFQSQLSVAHAVGRLWFPTLDEYAYYARSVVAAETGGHTLARRLEFFGAKNDDDPATQASAQYMIPPLAAALTNDPKAPGWGVECTLGKPATRERLSDLLHVDAPALLFTASHGMGFPNGDLKQFVHQGALLCQDWPGRRKWSDPIPEKFYFAGDHLKRDANLHGSIAFLFACFGAGTPERDEFSRYQRTGELREPVALAPHPFLAGLPTAMLGRERGALAVIGHVERAWGHSFLWGSGPGGGSTSQTAVFESALRSLMIGKPVGAAMEVFDARYGELSTMITAMLDDDANGIDPGPDLPVLWTANNDARGYAILGDPAVRAMVGDGAPTGREPLPPPRPVEVSFPAPAEPATSTIVMSVSGPAADKPFSLFRRKEQPAATADANGGVVGTLRGFVNKLGETISSALDDMSNLEVTTYTTSDMQDLFVDGKEVRGAQRRAYTRISLDGDTIIVVPERDGEIDRDLLALHQAVVKQAQEARSELMKTIVQAATSLFGLTK